MSAPADRGWTSPRDPRGSPLSTSPLPSPTALASPKTEFQPDPTISPLPHCYPKSPQPSSLKGFLTPLWDHTGPRTQTAMPIMEVLGSDYSNTYPGHRLPADSNSLSLPTGSEGPMSHLLLLLQILFSWSFHPCRDALPTKSITTASFPESQMSHTQLHLCPAGHQA